MPERVFVLGDSHVTALVHAIDRYGLKTPGGDSKFSAVYVESGFLSRTFVLKLSNGQTILNPILLKVMADCGLYDRFGLQFLPAVADLVIGFGYAESHDFGFGGNFEGYRFASALDASASDLRGEASDYLLPDEILCELLRPRVEPLFDGLRLLQAGGFNLSLMSGPPPHRDNNFILSCHPCGHINSPAVRRAIFYALHRVVRASAIRLNIEFIDGAKGFSDEDGFLKAEYECDGVHGNPPYGRDMLMAMAQRREWTVVDSNSC
jgi:hypothetical protein